MGEDRFFQDGAGGLNYGRYGNGDAVVQALPSPCQDAPIAVDLSVPGEALLATVGRFCASGDYELAVWRLTGLPGSATAVREMVMGSAKPTFDNFDFHWGSFARTPAADFFGVDIDGSGSFEVFFFVNVGGGWQEDVFSPRNSEAIDLAVRADGTVATLESDGELRLGTWAPGALTIEYTTMPAEVWGDGARWLDPSPGAEHVLMDDYYVGGVGHGYRSSGTWSRELVPFTRPSWWDLPGGTSWGYTPVGARLLSDGELVVGVQTDIEPALKAMYGADEVATQIAQRAPDGTWRTDIIHNGGYGGSYDRGPIDLDFGRDECGRLRVGFIVRDEFETFTDGTIWIYERH